MKRLFFRSSTSVGVSFLFLALITIISLNCRKFDLKSNIKTKKKTSNTFNVKDAKEWWFGTFRKNKSYKYINPGSPLTPKTGDLNNTRIPSWERAFGYNIGKLKVVESPLYAAKQKVLIPGSENLSDIEKDRIASATLRRLIMVKTPNNSVVARVVTIVPTLAYAQKYNYDISGFQFNKFLPNFDGYIFIGDWNENLINAVQVERGNVKRNLRFATRPVQQKNAHREASTTNSSSGQCLEWVSAWVRGCIDLAVGDEPPQLDCGDWRDEGYFVYVDCDNNQTTPYENCITNGGTPEDCACSLLGIGCPGNGSGSGNGSGNGNGNGNSGTGTSIYINIENNVTDPCMKSLVDQALDANMMNIISRFMITTFGTNETYSLEFQSLPFLDIKDTATDGKTEISRIQSPLTPTIRVKLNTLRLADASKEYIIATIFHELMHAWLVHTYPAAYEQNDQHNLFVSTPWRFNAMVLGLVEASGYTMNLWEAVALTWGGNGETLAFRSLSELEQSIIVDINEKHRKGQSGTPCQ